MTIREIRECAGKGYIDDPERVRKITESFCAMPVREIIGAVEGDLSTMLDALLPAYDLDSEDLWMLSYGDAICLIRNLDSPEASGLTTIEPADFKRFQITFLRRILMEASCANPMVKLFLCIGVGALFRCFWKRSNDGSIGGIYSRLVTKCARMCPDREDRIRTGKISLEDLLHEIGLIQNRSWKPWTSLEDYGREQTEASVMVEKLLVDAFYRGFREKMDLKVILTGLSADEYDYPDPEEYDEEEITAKGEKKI